MVLEPEPIGQLSKLETQLMVVAIDHGISIDDPPAEVLGECQDLDKTFELPREDFREQNVFSIDPEMARDLDDALHIRHISKDVVEVFCQQSHAWYIRTMCAVGRGSHSRCFDCSVCWQQSGQVCR